MVYLTRDYLGEYKVTVHLDEPHVIMSCLEMHDTRSFGEFSHQLFDKIWNDVNQVKKLDPDWRHIFSTKMTPDTKRDKLPYDTSKIASLHWSKDFDGTVIDFEIFFKMKWYNTSMDYIPVPRTFSLNNSGNHIFNLRAIPDGY